jgi:HEXXH motif-containing protein
VLLAVHAFVPVAELYARLLAAGDERVRDRFADVVGRNDEGLRTVRAHGKPTPIGAAMIEELERLHARHLALGAPKRNVEHEA